MQKTQGATEEIPLGLGARRYLLLTTVIAGAAVMIVEILGARILAPYVGTSHFVWTAQIGVALLALSAGYYAGGWLVDRGPRLEPLYAAIAVAAIYLALTMPLVEPLAYACLKFRLPLGTLLASMALYFVPLFLLAMAGPFAVRLLTGSMREVGFSAGRLAALSTVGSVLGTGLVGYVLIPRFSNSLTMWITSGVLLALSAGYFLVFGGRRRTGWAMVGLTVVVLGGIWPVTTRARDRHWSHLREVHFVNSNFGQLQVVETRDGTRRFLLNDFLVQNTYDPASGKSTSMFTYLLHGLGKAYAEQVGSALCIGLGVGIVPGLFAREGVDVEVVEINPAIPPIAERFFGCPLDRMKVTIADGRQFLNQTTRRYDVVILDAFVGDSSPSHLMSRESFESMRRVLAPGGAVVMNVFGDFEPGKDFYLSSIYKTVAAVFRSVRIHASGNGNVFVVASDRAELGFLREPDLESVHPWARDSAEQAFRQTHRTDPARGMVVTDDYNPLEYEDAGNRERLRRQFALNVLSM